VCQILELRQRDRERQRACGLLAGTFRHGFLPTH
jgi:hypothetical protein